MKDNKTLTYALIGGVLLIWGLVFYRFFDGSSEATGPTVFNKPVLASSKSDNHLDTFELMLNYRDPFLSDAGRPINYFNTGGFSSGAGAGTRTRTNAASVPKKVKEKEPEVTVDWKFLSYLGLVHNKVKNKGIGLLLVNGKEYMVNEGDQVEEVLVLKKGIDSIHVSYKNYKKWIKRE